MAYLTVFISLLTVVVAVNMFLVYGVIRRLREHTAQIARMLNAPAGEPIAQPGERARDFAATATDGTLVSSEHLAGQTLFAFFSPVCEPCKDKLPGFIEYARHFPGGRQQVVMVLAGEGAEAEQMCELLDPVARVVIEAPGGRTEAAFKVSGYPVMCVVDGEGTVEASGPGIESLRAAALA